MNIEFSNFNIDDYGKQKVKDIAEKYSMQITRKHDCGLHIRLREIDRGKTPLHQIDVKAVTSLGVLTSESVDYNIFKAVSTALKKIQNEITHKEKNVEKKKIKREGKD
ncbi:hypothetical protein COV15_03060 [Candidatus Woesearchaeota archaeon CG10_big_fil_rev_8_21_14_0_10_34_12]|nr:MAG: hypothetical protein COV15_03060 [Candidatus Woesearchaeota archaeon CG10_big_fil_rev_8_21_14_0_10_34_12]